MKKVLILWAAMAKLLSEAQSRFPNVRIIFLINTGLRKEIAGMDAIARQVLAVLQP